jgi:protein-tyrosine-phosphatase
LAIGNQEAPMAEKTYKIMFLSNRNTARSILAEAVANRKGGGRFKAYSAGLAPAAEVDPLVLDILKLSGYPTEGLHPKSWQEFAGTDSPQLDFVFTLCDVEAGERLPHWPSRPITADWRYPAPANLGREEWERRKGLSDILAGLERQFAAFIMLPFASLDRMSLRAPANRTASTGEARH